MAVGCLALVDLVLSTLLVPGLIKTYIVLDNFVPFNLCIVQMFTYYNFLTLESRSLCILSYDRFIAIGVPLKQKSINTNNRMAYIICAVWIFNSVRSLYGSSSISTLSFCDSLNVNRHFGNFAPVLRLL